MILRHGRENRAEGKKAKTTAKGYSAPIQRAAVETENARKNPLTPKRSGIKIIPGSVKANRNDAIRYFADEKAVKKYPISFAGPEMPKSEHASPEYENEVMPPAETSPAIEPQIKNAENAII